MVVVVRLRRNVEHCCLVFGFRGVVVLPVIIKRLSRLVIAVGGKVKVVIYRVNFFDPTCSCLRGELDGCFIRVSYFVSVAVFLKKRINSIS